MQLFNLGYSMSNHKIKNVDGKFNTLLDYHFLITGKYNTYTHALQKRVMQYHLHRKIYLIKLLSTC